MTIPSYLDPDTWLRNVFSAKAVGRGGVIHRAARDVERVVGRDAFLREVQRRGFTFHLMDRSHRLPAGPLQRILSDLPPQNLKPPKG